MKPYKAVNSWPEMFPDAAPREIRDANGVVVVILEQSANCMHPADPDPRRERLARIIVKALNESED